MKNFSHEIQTNALAVHSRMHEQNSTTFKHDNLMGLIVGYVYYNSKFLKHLGKQIERNLAKDKPLQFLKKWILNIDHQSESNSVTKDLALL